MLSYTEFLDDLQVENPRATPYLELLPAELRDDLRGRKSGGNSLAVSQVSAAQRDATLVSKLKAVMGEVDYQLLVHTFQSSRVSDNQSSESLRISHVEPTEYYEQSPEDDPQLKGVENSRISTVEVTSKYRCEFCDEEEASQLVFCSSCKQIMCLRDWASERRHSPKYPLSGSHRQVDLRKYEWVQSTLAADVDPTDQERLHHEDLRSLWFRLNIDDGSAGPKFFNTDVYEGLVTASTYADKTQQFPSLISFVGPTGAGKSTLIKGLIKLDPGREGMPTPVSGSEQNLGNPTSGDVHLYADPSTLDTIKPLLFVDCEGLDGGNSAPGAVKSLTGLGIRALLKEAWRTINDRDFYSSSPEGSKPTRKFCVEDFYPQIIYAFSDVICFVTERANTAEVTIERLIKWADKVLTKTVNQPTLPRAIIVANGMKNNPTGWLNEDVATNAMLKETSNMRLVDPEIIKIVESWNGRLPNGKKLNSLFDLLKLYFEGICVVYIPSKDSSTVDIIYEQYQKLRDRIAIESKKVQDKKDLSWSRLNTTELARFFNGAFDHFSHKSNEPFDFFRFSRKNNPLPASFEQHTSNLMRKMEQYNQNVVELDNRIASIVASCISLSTLDAETFRFPPDRVIEEFQEICERAYMHYYDSAPCSYANDGKRCVNLHAAHDKGHQDSSGEIFSQGDYIASHSSSTRQEFWRRISASYSKTAVELWQLKNSTREYTGEVISRHKAVLASEESFWKATISHVTCFVCLFHHPDNVLPCGHAICDACIKRFGVPDKEDASVFQFARCYLCQQGLAFQSQPLQIQLKPEESGVRLLCLDGGGVGGVISCKVLQLLEHEIGFDIPIEEFFDCIVGTGTGGIIALGLGRNHWTAQTCLEKFKYFIRHAFKRHALVDVPFIGRLVTYWRESYYQTTEIETQLQQAFNDDAKERLLFGDDFAGPYSGGRERCRALKMAIPATTTINPELCLITNYNRPKDIDVMKLYRQDNPKNEMEVWEAARCTSAIPKMFCAYEAKNGQRFHDGDLRDCNPVKIATEETMLLWPKSSQLDCIVTIGTGYTDQPIQPAASREGLSGFMQRFWPGFGDHFDSEMIWRDYKASIDPAQLNRYHRFNLELSRNSLPNLDDVSKINDLEIATSEACYPGRPLQLELRKAADSLIAALFYMRIDSISRALEETYWVNATIVCRLGRKYHPKVATALLMRNAHFDINSKESTITGDLLKFVLQGGHLCVPVDFVLENLAQMVDISLVLDTSRKPKITSHHISGSPRSLGKHHNLVSDGSSRFSRRSSRSSMTSLSGAYTPSATETLMSYNY